MRDHGLPKKARNYVDGLGPIDCVAVSPTHSIPLDEVRPRRTLRRAKSPHEILVVSKLEKWPVRSGAHAPNLIFPNFFRDLDYRHHIRQLLFIFPADGVFHSEPTRNR